MLAQWLDGNNRRHQLLNEITNQEILEAELELFGQADPELAWQRIRSRLVETRNKKVHQTILRWWWVAAALLLALGTTWFWKSPRPEQHAVQTAGATDLPPGTKKALLVLANGNVVQLGGRPDSLFTENGSLVKRGSDGSLVYSAEGAEKESSWNNIRVPNGGEYLLQLEDGTRVWLNAATTLHYPVRFTGRERRVELGNGEAYFEIAKNPRKPFIVVSGKMEVQALGTAFDVNAYPRSDSSRSATLVEGRVVVTSPGAGRYLHPGEQLALSGSIAKVLKPDIESVTAWKNGLFLFNGTDLEEVMQQIARWYDVQIVYDSSFASKKFFTGEIKRSVPVSKLLGMMEETGIARFKIESNTIIVSAGSP